MSKDFQIAFPCPHLIVEEHVKLGSDRRSLFPKSPIAAKGTISVMMNDDFYVPSTGLYSTAVLKSSFAGPFRIVKNEDTLRVSSVTESHSFTLPRGLRVPTHQLIDLFNSEFKKKAAGLVAVSNKGFLIIYDTASSGGNSRVFVEGTGLKALGFDKTRSAKGREIYPPWQLVKTYYPDEAVATRYIRFLSPLRSNPIIKISYTTVGDFCVRCGGTYVENDFRYDSSSGEMILIGDENLLYQTCLKALLTLKGSNPYHKWYGTSLMNSIGKKSVIGLQNTIKQEISSALEMVQAAQTSQLNLQKVSQRERLFSLVSVEILPNQEDPTVYLVEVVVKNASGTPISLSIVYTAPNAIALAGSNGKSLGLR